MLDCTIPVRIASASVGRTGPGKDSGPKESLLGEALAEAMLGH